MFVYGCVCLCVLVVRLNRINIKYSFKHQYLTKILIKIDFAIIPNKTIINFTLTHINKYMGFQL